MRPKLWRFAHSNEHGHDFVQKPNVPPHVPGTTCAHTMRVGKLKFDLSSFSKKENIHYLFLNELRNSDPQNYNHHAIEAILGPGRGVGRRWDVGFLHKITSVLIGMCKAP